MGYETDLKLFIDGVWKSADAGHTVVNPVDAKPIGEVPFATKADLEEALAASDRAWPQWKGLDVEKRAAILHKVGSVGQVAERPWQSSRRPAPKPRDETFEQRFKRLLIALLHSIDQVEGRRFCPLRLSVVRTIAVGQRHGR